MVKETLYLVFFLIEGIIEYTKSFAGREGEVLCMIKITISVDVISFIDNATKILVFANACINILNRFL